MSIAILQGDARHLPLADESIQCCVTSPPYWGLRDYNINGQLGLEMSAADYITNLVTVCREIKRVLKPNGTFWLNLGDSYAGGGNYRGIHSENALTSKQNSNRGSSGVSQNVGALGKDAGVPPKNLVGIPWRTAFALQADGWILRSDIIWAKPNPMPESIRDRPTKSHEYLFLLVKQPKYYYDADSIKEPYAADSLARYQYRFGGPKNEGFRAFKGEHLAANRTRMTGFKPYHGQATKDYDAATAQNPSDSKRRILASMAKGGGRNKRDVWFITPQPFKGAHFATFPEKLVEPCILAGTKPGDVVLDPFCGSGTVGVVAKRHHRSFVGVDIHPDYLTIAQQRIGAYATTTETRQESAGLPDPTELPTGSQT